MEERGSLDLTKQIDDLKKRAKEAEGELSIIKGIGNNSPEMRALKDNNEFLTNQNKILKEALRKGVGQIHTLKYENSVLGRKIKLAEDWVGQLRDLGL